MTIAGVNNLSDNASFAAAERFFSELFYGGPNEHTDRNPYAEPTTTLEKKVSSVTGFAPLLPEVNIRAAKNHLQNIIDELKQGTKGINFILSNTALHALNPELGQGQIYNPLSAFGPVPGSSGYQTTTLDNPIATRDPGTEIARNEDRLIQMYNGEYTKIQTVAAIPPVERQGPKVRFGAINAGPAGAFGGETIGEKIRKLNTKAPPPGPSNFGQDESIISDFNFSNESFGPTTQNLQTREVVPGVEVTEKPDYEKLFRNKSTGPAFGKGAQGYNYYEPVEDARVKASTFFGYSSKRKALQNDDTFFTKVDAERGYLIKHEDVNFIEGVDGEVLNDDDTYIPFYFVDLRRPERRLYFRAFLNSISENFTSDWNTERYYGRIDPVGVYMNTTRNLSISWKIAAFSSVGLSTMYKKINNFIKMMYPTFKEGVLHSAPVLGIRVGDVIGTISGNAQLRDTLPGFITNASLDYNPNVWEVTAYDGPSGRAKELGKSPMICDMSMNFQVIHERNPEVDKRYKFDTFIFRRMGTEF